MEKYLRIGMLVLGVFLVGSAIQAITKNRIAYYQKVELATQEKVAAKNRELVALKDRQRASTRMSGSKHLFRIRI